MDDFPTPEQELSWAIHNDHAMGDDPSRDAAEIEEEEDANREYEAAQTDLDLVGLVPDEPFREEIATTILGLDQIDGWDGGDPPSKQFVANVKLLGLINPPKVRAVVGGRYTVIEGRRRLKALALLGVSRTGVVVEENEGRRDAVSAIAANFNRSQNHIGTARSVIDALGTMSLEQLAATTGVKKDTLAGFRDMLTRLHPDLVVAAEQGKMASWATRHASRLSETRQRNLLAILAEKGKITDQDVINERRAKQREAAAAMGDDLFDLPSADAIKADLEARGAIVTEVALEDVKAAAPEAVAQVEAAKPTKVTREQRRSRIGMHLLAIRQDLKAMRKRDADEDDLLTLVEDFIERLKEGVEVG